MENIFHLYWRRENGCDAGTPVSLQELDPLLQPRVAELAQEFAQELAPPAAPEFVPPMELHLPFLDLREWRRRSEMLRTLELVREGRAIRYVPTNASAVFRDSVADLVGGHHAWTGAPVERQRYYFRTWRGVSVAIQEFLRRKALEIYFRDIDAYEDRAAAWPLLVYHALRPCHGVPETEFTYDIADIGMLDEALKLMQRPLRDLLETARVRLAEAGRAELSRRYAPIWHEDVVRAVRAKPRRLLAVLGDEAMLVDAVITLGASKNLSLVKPFTRRIMTTLRSFYDCDMRELAIPLMEEVTRALEEAHISRPNRNAQSALGATLAAKSAAPRKHAVTSRRVLSLPLEETDQSFSAVNTYGRYMPENEVFL